MAGMLPGVEAARRRRFHQSNLYGSSELSPSTSGRSTRRPSFCLYSSSYECHRSSISSMRNPMSQRELCDESKLGEAAREAKKRLDHKLQAKWKSETKRTTDVGQRLGSLTGRVPTTEGDSVSKLKVSKPKKLRWLKLNWKSSEQEECAVCLELFKAAGRKAVAELACGHKFHGECLVPWLEGHAHCPCCRMEIPPS